jgi:homoserine O-acetyltransferase
MEFPCLEKLNDRQVALERGPEPQYDKIVSGYSVYSHKESLKLFNFGNLPTFQIAYETWGELNEQKDNAILIHTGLSGSSHAKSHSKNPNNGWWEDFIGPGKSIDTNKFHVICTNVIGGCYGSTGPQSISEEGTNYATK